MSRADGHRTPRGRLTRAHAERLIVDFVFPNEQNVTWTVMMQGLQSVFGRSTFGNVQ